MSKQQYITNSMKMKYDVLYNFISPVTGNIIGNGNIAPSDATYILRTSNEALPNAQALDTIGSGYLYNTNGSLSSFSPIRGKDLPNLSEDKIWIGNFFGRPVEKNLKDLIDDLDLGGGGVSSLLGLAGLLAGLGGLLANILSPGGKETLLVKSNIDMSQNRITNLSSSIQNNYDAVNAQWVWDLLNDKLLINGMGLSHLVTGNVHPELYILGETQSFNYNHNSSTFRLNNSFAPTNYVSNQTLFEFRNNLLSGFRWIHSTNSIDTYGSLTLQNFINASPTGTNLLNFSNIGIGTFVPLQFYNPLGTNYVALKAGNVTSNVTWTLPIVDGAYGQALITNGSGILSWSSTGVGSVTSITAGTGLTGGTITTSGTIAIANTAVSAGSYTYGNFTVNAQGQLTSASSGATPLLVSNNLSDLNNTSTARTNLGLTNIAIQTVSQYNTLVGGASNSLVSISPGTSGWLLTSNGSTANPSYQLYTGSSSLVTVGTISSGTWNGTTIGLSYGGTNANLTASNGGIFYSTATSGAILSGTSTANQLLLSGASGAPSWSTVTHPATTTVNQILYSSANNVLSGLPTANNAVLITNSSGVPAMTSTPSGLTSIGVGNLSLTGNTISSTNTNGDINISPNGHGNFIVNAGSIGTTQWSNQQIFYGTSNSGNADNFKIINVRYNNGSDWTSSEIRLQKIVDASYQHYISFRGNTGYVSNLVFGFGGLTGGTELAALSQDGKWTIGSTTATAPLMVCDTASESTKFGSVQIVRSHAPGDNLFYLSFINSGWATAGIGFIPNSISTIFGIWNAQDCSGTPSIAFDRSQRVGIGTSSPDSTSLLNISGTQTTTSGSNQFNVLLNPILAPTGGAGFSNALYLNPNFLSPSAQTITNACSIEINPIYNSNIGTITTAYGIYVASGTSSSGTLTTNYSAYFSNPTAGTNKCALYADNACIGYTSTTPATNSLMVSGKVSVGTTSNYDKLLVDGGAIVSLNQVPSFAWMGDIPTARWLSKLGSSSLTFNCDNSNTFSTGDNVTYQSSTFRSKIVFGPDGAISAYGISQSTQILSRVSLSGTTGNKAFPSGAFTAVNFNGVNFSLTTSYDPNSWWNGGTTITVPATGKYFLSAALRFGDQSGGNAGGFNFFVNGAASNAEFIFAQAGNRRSAAGQALFSLNSGDAITLRLYQDSGTDIAISYVNFTVERYS